MEPAKSKAIEQRIEEAETLLKCAQNLKKNGKQIPGSVKFANRIKAEIRFLKKLHTGKIELKQSHLTSSNLTSLRAILSVINTVGCQCVSSILQPFKEDFKQSICVDIVANEGHLWIKVIARNSSALRTVWKGQGQFGDRNLVDIAKDFLDLVAAHPVDYQLPKVVFYFLNGVPIGLANDLISIGTVVVGDIDLYASNGDSSDEEESSANFNVKTTPISSLINCNKEAKVTDCVKEANTSSAFSSDFEICKANLDITTMLSLVSNLSNGHDHFVYGLPVLDEQASQERKSKILPILETFLQGKELIACETAVKHFKHIVETIGGLNEKARAEDLLLKLTVVKDNPSKRTEDLASSSKINARAKIIFGTGDRERAISVTANSGFVRAALQNGVKYSVFEHEARALTESKEKNATVFQS